jgi:hypothetical protein
MFWPLIPGRCPLVTGERFLVTGGDHAGAVATVTSDPVSSASTAPVAAQA